MKITITGDFCPMERIKTLISSLNSEEILSDFKDIFQKSDLTLTNLETSIINNYCKPAKKIGINIGNYPEILSFLKQNGFNLVTLANNHFMDYGNESAEYALHCLNEIGLEYIGAGRDTTEVQKVKIIEKIILE
ncbi:MAG: hypothetical protein HDR88_04260 [Bacteroides sp.]|nr:hypothetical protein [Bacteroides sp.]